MKLSGINGIELNQEIFPASGKQKPKTLDSIFLPGIGGVKQTTHNDQYNEFNSAVNNSVLNGNFLSEKDLFKQGFIKSGLMDMNGGIYYKKGDECIRIGHLRKTLSYTNENKNMSHFVVYDDNGKETRGVVQIKQSDGTIKVYSYDVDTNGNRFIKSVETSPYKYFGQYE